MSGVIRFAPLAALLSCFTTHGQEIDLRLIAGHTRVIAHRGGAGPENTIATDLRSISRGIRFLEHDVQITSDGHPVLLHDPTVDRTTNGSGYVADLTLADIEELDAGAWFVDPIDPSRSYAGERIPTVADALREVGNRAVLLLEPKDVKTAAAVIDAIRAENAFSRVVVRSLDETILAEVKRIEPRIMTGAYVLDVPTSDELDSFLSRLERLDVAAVSVYMPDSITWANVSILRGMDIAVWGPTADDESTWERLYAAGVDGIMTNRPIELLAWLEARSESVAR